MCQQRAVALSAAPHVGLSRVDESRHVERLGARGKGLGVDPQLLGVGIAVVEGRAARADAARVDADDVEAPADGARGRVARCARTARRRRPDPPGWMNSRSDAVLAVDRGEAHEREVDRATARAAVVERHLRGGALKAVVAVAPISRGTGACSAAPAGATVRASAVSAGCEQRGAHGLQRAGIAAPNRRTPVPRSGRWRPRSRRRWRVTKALDELECPRGPAIST